MADLGIKITDEKDVRSASGADLVFTSTAFGLKIAQTGTDIITIPAGSPAFTTVSKQISHSLGYPPAWFAFIEDQNGNFLPYGMASYNKPEDPNVSHPGGYTTSTLLVLGITNKNALGAAITRKFRYFLFVDPGT